MYKIGYHHHHRQPIHVWCGVCKKKLWLRHNRRTPLNNGECVGFVVLNKPIQILYPTKLDSPAIYTTDLNISTVLIGSQGGVKLSTSFYLFWILIVFFFFFLLHYLTVLNYVYLPSSPSLKLAVVVIRNSKN